MVPLRVDAAPLRLCWLCDTGDLFVVEVAPKQGSTGRYSVLMELSAAAVCNPSPVVDSGHVPLYHASSVGTASRLTAVYFMGYKSFPVRRCR
jgi:hypothetical protein